MSALISAREEGAVLDDDEIVATCSLLLFAGHETTTSLIGTSLYTLFQYPEQLDLLRRQPDLAAGCVEEVLRFDGPVQRISRIASGDLEWEGKKISAGQRVVLVVASANRDPDVFPDPNTFDIRRSPNPHLGFGRGIHFCPGAALSRMETEITLKTLFTCAPQLRLEKPVELENSGLGFRGPIELPLLF